MFAREGRKITLKGKPREDLPFQREKESCFLSRRSLAKDPFVTYDLRIHD